MVATAKVSERIDFDLRIVRLMIEDLPDLECAWPDETPENQFVETQEWENTLAQFRSLRQAYEAGQMTEAQRHAYEHVLAALRAARPTIERLGLATSADMSRTVNVRPSVRRGARTPH